MPKAKNKEPYDSNKDEEYGVVLKSKKFKRKIYPQKGKKPLKEDDSYKIV